MMVDFTDASLQDVVRNIIPIIPDDDLKEMRRLVEMMSPVYKLDESHIAYEDFYNPTTLRELKQNYPTFDWTTYIQSATLGAVPVTDDLQLNIGSPDLLSKFFLMLGTIKPTNVLRFQLFALISDYLRAIPKDGDNPIERCAGDLVNYFPAALNYIFVLWFKDATKRQMATEMFEALRSEFKNILGNDTKRFDTTTRRLALYKLDAMRGFIGYSDGARDKYRFIQFYKDGADIYDYDLKYYEIIRIMSQFKTKKALDKYSGDPVTREMFHMIDPLQQPYHVLLRNAINIGLGVLQSSSLIDPDLPEYVNYAQLGMIMAHELMHGFDMMGRQFGVGGQFNQYYSAESLAKWKETEDCLRTQYKEFMKMDGVSVDDNFQIRALHD